MDVPGDEIKRINQMNAENVLSQCEYWVEKAKSVNIAVSQAITRGEHAPDTYLPCFSVMDDILVKLEEEMGILQQLIRREYDD